MYGKRIKVATFMVFMFVSTTASAFANWTSEKIVSVTSYSDGKATIRIENYSNPNPAGSTWGCTAGVMYLGNLTDPAPNGLLSVALSAHATQKSIRYGVYGSGSDCYINYITINEN